MDITQTAIRLNQLLSWKCADDNLYIWQLINGMGFVEYHTYRIGQESIGAWENNYATHYMMVLESRVKAGF